MASTQQHQRWLKDMGLPQQDLQLLAAQNIQTARDLLTQSAVDLVERLNIPLSQAQRILQAAAVQVAPPYVTVSVCADDSHPPRQQHRPFPAFAAPKPPDCHHTHMQALELHSTLHMHSVKILTGLPVSPSLGAHTAPMLGLVCV